MRVFRRLVETNLNDAGETHLGARTVSFSRRASRSRSNSQGLARPSLEAAIAKHASSDARSAFHRTMFRALGALFAQPSFLVSHTRTLARHLESGFAVRERRATQAVRGPARASPDGALTAADAHRARRGRQPAVWIPWEEARATMRRWSENSRRQDRRRSSGARRSNRYLASGNRH